MKLKSGFGLREICGEKVLVAEGLENIDFSKIVNLNETAAYLWEKLDGRENFEVDDMVALLLEEYDVSADVARRDCEDLADRWIEAGLAVK